MLRTAVVLALVAACSSGAQKPAEPLHEAVAPAAAHVDAVSLFAPSVTGVMRAPASDFPIITYFGRLFEPAPACWTRAVAGVRAAYQLEQLPNHSYVVIEGAPARDQLEACVREGFPEPIKMSVRSEGPLAVAQLEGVGTVYLAWKGDVMVAGNKAQVTEALAGAPAAVEQQWRERMAALPPGKLAMWRQDVLVTNLFGVATQSYMLTIDSSSKPAPTFSGRLIIRYGTAGDAAIAARKIRTGELATPNTPPEIVGAFKAMRVAQHAGTVEVTFDYPMFEHAGVTMDVLQRWVVGVAGAAAP